MASALFGKTDRKVNKEMVMASLPVMLDEPYLGSNGSGHFGAAIIGSPEALGKSPLTSTMGGVITCSVSKGPSGYKLQCRT